MEPKVRAINSFAANFFAAVKAINIGINIGMK